RHERLETEVLRRADRVLAASRTHADRLRARFTAAGLDPARVVHLPNGYEPSEGGAALSAAPRADAWVVAYTGTLSLMPDVGVFLEAIHDLLARLPEARRRLRARLMGPFDTGYRDRAEALGLTGIVEFMGPRPHAEARALQRGAGLLVHWQPREFPTMVPGKLYEYFEAGRPIVAVLDPATEAAGLLRQSGATVVPPGDRAALSAELERHYRAWREHGPEPARIPVGLEDHRRDRIATRLAVLLDQLVAVSA
ncbi:MAG TPA: glycosyltransferase, partial [Dongiaceae bacterium]|nr:glycosyltransferase [Dongiaceae bacterium]